MSLRQPTTTGLESVQGVVSQFSTVGTGSSGPGGKDNEPLVATHEVRPLVAAYSANAHRSRQIPTQVIVKDIENAGQNVPNVEFISGSAETTVVGQLDSINSTYLQPLSIFNAVVTGIANVRFSKRRWSNLNLRSCIDPPIRPNGIIRVENGI